MDKMLLAPLRRSPLPGAPRVLRSALVALAVGAAALHGAPARAQSSDDLERARSEFRQGLSLEAAGNWSAALAKFQSVGKVKLTPQVRFHTGRCNEQLGRLNEALGDYRLAEYEAGQQGLPELESIAQSRQALEARIPKLVIRRGEGAELARVELDGVELGEAQIGQPLSVDPGPHTVVARLPGDRQFQQSASAKESETAELVLVAPTDGAAVAPGASGGASGETNAKDLGTTATKPGVLPWVVGGVGVAGLIGAGTFYVLRKGAESDLDDTCRGTVCPKSIEDTQNKGELYTTLSLVSLGVGVVGLGVATYLFVSAPKGGPEKANVFVPVDVAALPHGGGQLTVRARF